MVVEAVSCCSTCLQECLMLSAERLCPTAAVPRWKAAPASGLVLSPIVYETLRLGGRSLHPRRRFPQRFGVAQRNRGNSILTNRFAARVFKDVDTAEFKAKDLDGSNC